MELLAVVTLLGILAAVVIPRFAGQSDQAKTAACDVNRGNIEVQTQLWFRNKGTWPTADLGDIGSNPDYFPDGLPKCPFDGSDYRFDSMTQRVTGHQH